jgi:ubiquinone/menaquinone biosynthesis C-methylase UbiE
VRADFAVADAADLSDHGEFDGVMLLETLHDLARPAEALAAARRALRDGGSVLVVDEQVAPAFTAPGDTLERMMYGWSIAHCLPTQRVEQPSAAIGTVLRQGRLEELAAEAGFSTVETVPVDAGLFRVYHLTHG